MQTGSIVISTVCHVSEVWIFQRTARLKEYVRRMLICYDPKLQGILLPVTSSFYGGLYPYAPCLQDTSVQTRIFQQLFNGLSWDIAQPFIFPIERIQMTLVIPWLCLERHKQVVCGFEWHISTRDYREIWLSFALVLASHHHAFGLFCRTSYTLCRNCIPIWWVLAVLHFLLVLKCFNLNMSL